MNNETWHWNIYLTLVYTCVLNILGNIIWGPLFDNYIFSLFDKENAVVGYLESVIGIAGLVFAIPTGWIVESYDNLKLLRISIGIGILFSFVYLWSLHLGKQLVVWVFAQVKIVFFVGLYDGFVHFSFKFQLFEGVERSFWVH